MKFLKDLHAVSEFLFYAFGLLLIVAFLFWKNDALAYQAELFLRYADLPFAFVAVVFGAVSLRISFSQDIREENKILGNEEDELEHPILDAILIIVGISIILSLIYIDIVLPDRI